jgi:heptosyltransferase-2
MKHRAPRRLLLTRIDRLGDVILTTPVFQLLKETYPDLFLAVLVSPANREAVEGDPFVDEVIVYDKRGRQKSWWGTVMFARRIAAERFDTCIHFHATNRVFWLSFLAGIPVRIGHKRKVWRLLTHPVIERKREGRKHETEYNLDLLEALGFRSGRPLPPLYFPLDEEKRLSLIKRSPEVKTGPYAVISPSASCPSKRWPPERFRAVARELNRVKGLRIFLTGTPDERGLCSEVKKGIEAEVTDLSGKLSLGELAWLIKGARLLISNDSGPVHIAAALDVPVISLFGRSDPGLSPTRWRPLGAKSVFIHKGSNAPETVYDYTRPCKRLLAIRPEEVLKEAEGLL